AAVLFGGWLALFTGYSKGLAELVPLVVAIAAFGARVVRDDRGHLGLALSTATVLASHRSGIVVVPAAIAAWVLGARAHGMSRRSLAGMAAPALVGAIAAPRVVTLVQKFDVARHVVGADPVGGPRALDLLNVLVLLAPLGACIPVLAAAFGPTLPRRAELGPLFVLALALVALGVVVHPLQGVVRDWDVYAPAGVAMAMLAARLAGDAPQGAPRSGW